MKKDSVELSNHIYDLISKNECRAFEGLGILESVKILIIERNTNSECKIRRRQK